MILWRMEDRREGLRRQISPSCLVSPRLSSAGPLEGSVRFTGPYVCMCFVREGQMVANVIRVSFTSCCRSMLSAELLLHHSASAVAFQMLWAQCKEWLNYFTCFLSLPSSSPSLLLIYPVLSSRVVPLSGQRNCTLILPVAALPIFPQTNSKWRMCFLYLWYNLSDITWDKTLKFKADKT